MAGKKPHKPVDIVGDIYRDAPNPYTCEGCPDWDDINGCWAGYMKYYDCDELGEESSYMVNHVYGIRIDPDEDLEMNDGTL